MVFVISHSCARRFPAIEFRQRRRRKRRISFFSEPFVEETRDDDNSFFLLINFFIFFFVFFIKQTVSSSAFVQGENVTVSVTATNAGLANARNVVVKAPQTRNEGKWTQVNEESLEQKMTNLDVGETKEMTYVYNVKDAGTYTVEPATIQYFASDTREVTKGESNVVKNVKVLTPMQNNARKALRVTGFFSLGALNTVEDWLKFSKWIAGTIALFLLNWFALKIKYGLQSLRRMAAVRGLEGDAKLE